MSKIIFISLRTLMNLLEKKLDQSSLYVGYFNFKKTFIFFLNRLSVMSISRDVSDKDANAKLNHKIKTLSEKCYSTLEQNNVL